MPRAGSTYHRDRFRDLKKMADEWRTHDARSPWLGRLRICLPAESAGSVGVSDFLQVGREHSSRTEDGGVLSPALSHGAMRRKSDSRQRASIRERGMSRHVDGRGAAGPRSPSPAPRRSTRGR
jgi:hypothetical protein